jgi:hypothetical protein
MGLLRSHAWRDVMGARYGSAEEPSADVMGDRDGPIEEPSGDVMRNRYGLLKSCWETTTGVLNEHTEEQKWRSDVR